MLPSFNAVLLLIALTFLGSSRLKAYPPQEQASINFPASSLVESVETKHPQTHHIIRKKILKTNFKYPYICTEQHFDPTTQAALGKEIAMVADHVLVTLAAGETPTHFLQQLNIAGAYLEKVPVQAALYRLKLNEVSLKAIPDALELIASKHLAIINCEPDYICSTSDHHTINLPDDPLYQYQYNLWKSWTISENGDTDGCTFDYGIDAQKAWTIQNSAASIIVAIIDSGIRYTHEDLADNMWHNPKPTMGDLYGINTIANNGDPMDDEGHGTHCAGIIGAVGNNGIGITGIAWKVQLMACKFLDATGQGTISDEVAAIDYACDHGARILNCSFGNVFPSNVEKSAFEQARDRHIIVVTAAGNNSASDDVVDGESSNLVSYPAAYHLDNIVAVASISSFFNSFSAFSNYGKKTVGLAAPGEMILSTWFHSDHSYHVDSGTSMAAPHVTGALALMMERFPNLSYQQLISRLLSTTDKFSSLKEKTISGGRLNLYHALRE